jgi:hydroxyacylglutathione hydrolase
MMPSEPTPPLEDSHVDILGKAQRGLKLGGEKLASRAGSSAVEFDRIQAGEIPPEPLGRLAASLNLGAQALADAARKAWRPQAAAVGGLKTFTTRFEDMTVNSYLVWDAVSKGAVAFDSGADVGGKLDFAATYGPNIELILIIHTHGFHILNLDRLCKKTGAPAWLGDREATLAIESHLTCGRANGGISYVLSGLLQPVATVGDAIFAGSMGGGKISYADALGTTRKEILSLPDGTILTSSVAPLTTVAEEKIHSAFFAA